MDNISIILHVPGAEPFAVTVNCHDTALALEPYLEGEGLHSFYYKDIPICPAFTFKWFGIGDGTHIFVDSMEPQLNGKLSPTKAPQSKNQIFGGKKSSKKAMISATNKKRQRSKEAPSRLPMVINDFNTENARIKDQFFRKVEGTAVCYRKIMKRFVHASANEHGGRQSQQHPTIISECADQPSTDGLPIFWRDEGISYSTISSPITNEM